MKLIDEKIWWYFFQFDIDGKAFNALPDREKQKYANTVRYSVKEALTENFSTDSEKLKRVFRLIVKKVDKILFG